MLTFKSAVQPVWVYRCAFTLHLACFGSFWIFFS